MARRDFRAAAGAEGAYPLNYHFPCPDLSMSSTITPATHRANFAIGSEATARNVVDLLTESFFEGQAAIAAFERPDGIWDVTVHFAEEPDQASIRELVGLAAGEDVARSIAFDTVEA